MWKSEWQDEHQRVQVHFDSDWAGCKTTRRSTMGGVVKHGKHVMKTWSKTLTSMMLSSVDAELHALVKSSAEAIEIKSVFNDVGYDVPHRGVRGCKCSTGNSIQTGRRTSSPSGHTHALDARKGFGEANPIQKG